MSTAELLEQSLNERRLKSPANKGWALFWATILASSIPMLLVYFTRLWSMERYQYFPFVFVVVGVLVYKRFDRLFHPPKNWYRWSQVAMGVVLVCGSIFLESPWLAAVGFVVLMASFLGSSCDRDGRSLITIVLPLLMLVRLPLGYDQLLVIKLQSITTDLSSVMLDLFGVPHSAAANVIRLPDRELFVAEACSGIQSVFTLAFLALVVVTFFERRIWLTPIYLAIAILLAIAANVMRVTIVAVGQAWHGVDLATGWPHEAVGYVALATAILFLLSFDQLVVTLLHPVDSAEDDSAPNPVTIAWNWLVGEKETSGDTKAGASRAAIAPRTGEMVLFFRNHWGRIAFAVVVVILSAGSVAQATRLAFFDDDDQVAPPRGLVFEVPEQLFAAGQYQHFQIGEHDVSRGGSNPRLGDNADLWQISIGDLSAQMVLSQPYTGWHELCMCYEIRDWLLINREVVEVGEDQDAEEDPLLMPIALARLKSEQGSYGYLFYTCLGSNGDVIAPPPKPGRLGSRFDDLIYSGDAYDRQDLMMLQLWVVTNKKLDPDRVNEIKSDFVLARGTVVGAMKGARPGQQQEAVAQAGDGGEEKR